MDATHTTATSEPLAGSCELNNFSIIVPCYNDGDVLGRCLASISKQCYAVAEVIVIDDGSEDDTQQVCAEFASSASSASLRFVYQQQENCGVSTARNKGIELATSDYLVFVDADDELDENALKNYNSALGNHCPVGLPVHWLVASHQWERNDRVKSRTIELPKSKLARFKQFISKGLHLGNISNMCFARTAFAELPFPTSLRFGEDTVVFAIMLTKFDPVVIGTVAALAHRRNTSLRSRATLQDLIASEVHSQLFEHKLLPPEYQRFRDLHWARNCQSIARRAYREKQYDQYLAWYKNMVTAQPQFLLNLHMILRYLRAKSLANLA